MIPDLAARIADELPDEPRWLETRAMLRFAEARVTGGPSANDGFVVRLLHDALSAISVVGTPPGEKIVRATDDVTSMTPVLAQVDNAGHVQRALGEGWRGERAFLHSLASRGSPLADPDGPDAIRLLTPADSLSHLPAGLRHELTHARMIAPVAAAFVGGVPVSFCYPCWITESLWDVSIDTLEDYRGRSLARHAAAFMIDHMRREGREPVWGALASNTASLRLAASLGFVKVDELVVFSRGPWAFFTAGFEPTTTSLAG